MHLRNRHQAENSYVVTGSFTKVRRAGFSLKLLTVSLLLITLTASASAVALSRNPSLPASTVVDTAEDRHGVSRDLTTKSEPVAHVSLTPNCSRGSYSLPSTVDPSKMSNGVHYKIDEPATYNVYGDSAESIILQIYNCTPVIKDGRYAANTGYNLSSYYTYIQDSDGLCSVASATVTLHINQVYPEWKNTGADADTARAWDSFITNLRKHEDGHTRLDKQYADQMYDTIVGVSKVSCETINTAVKDVINNVISSLNSANNDYDAATDHGSKQGAKL